MSGKVWSSRTLSSTRDVRRSVSTRTLRASTPSRVSCSLTKRPIGSSPPPLISADLSPRRAAPLATLAGRPADSFGECRDVLQTTAELLPIQVYADATDRDEVQLSTHACKDCPHFGSSVAIPGNIRGLYARNRHFRGCALLPQVGDPVS